jgi:hypothetical protein
MNLADVRFWPTYSDLSKMSAFGGKADIEVKGFTSAFDPTSDTSMD